MGEKMYRTELVWDNGNRRWAVKKGDRVIAAFHDREPAERLAAGLEDTFGTAVPKP